MSVRVTLLPRRNLLVATYSGVAGLAETVAAAEAAARHPDFHPAMRHLVDVSAITDYERDFPGFFAMQARVMDSFAPEPHGLVIAFFAPSRVGQQMAELARRSWDGLDHAIIRIFDHEEAALDFLGLAEERIGALLELPG